MVPYDMMALLKRNNEIKPSEENIMMYFKNRALVRAFASKSNRQVIDNGSTADAGKRWAVKVR